MFSLYMYFMRFIDILLAKVGMALPYAFLQWKFRKCRLAEEQSKTLKRILQQIDPQSLKEYGLSVNDVDNFQKIPIRSYQEMNSKEQRLNAFLDPSVSVLSYIKTSGSTGPYKVLPLTKQGLAGRGFGFLSLGIVSAFEWPGKYFHGFLQITSPSKSKLNCREEGAGEATGVMASLLYNKFRLFYAVPPIVSEIEDVRMRYYMIIRLAMTRPRLQAIMTATPQTLELMADVLKEHSQRLVDELALGECKILSELPVFVSSELSAVTRRRYPFVAKRLKRILREKSFLEPKDVWPFLTVGITWTGGNFANHIEKVKRLYGFKDLTDPGLSASEGHFTVPYRSGQPDSLLNVWHYYFEFRCVNDLSSVVDATGVKVGEDYELVVSTPDGLLRYDLQDKVRIQGVVGEIPLVKFLSKTSDWVDLTGEKLSAFHVIDLGRKLLKDKRFVLAGNNNGSGYILYCREEVAFVTLREFERGLCEMNEIYKEHLQVGKLLPLEGRVMPDFDSLDLYFRNKRKSSVEQFKPPILLKELPHLDANSC